MSMRFERIGVLTTLVAVPLVLAACANLGNPDSGSTTQTTAELNPVVATIDGAAIYRDAIDEWLKDDWLMEIAENPENLYQLRRAGIDGVIDDALIDAAAAKSGETAQAYLEREASALGPVTDEEIDDFYARNQDRIRPAQTLDELRPRILKFLEGDRAARVVSNLRAGTTIEVLMTPPPAPPVQRISLPSGSVSRGPDDAPITIVEFSDYQCPYCQRAEATLHQLDALFPGKLRFEYRHLPHDFHENALPAAKAAVCAGNQGRFWNYHDLLFKNPRALGGPQLLAYASQLSLDTEAFKACLELPATLDQVNADIALAKAVGAQATPTFFVNGIMLRGAQPAEAFRTIIERELAERSTAP